MSFYHELKRRNVFRVGAAYIVSAWLLIQVAETIFPLFGYGDTPARITVILLAIGLPLSLVFSWVFELTPEGLKKENDIDRTASVVHKTGKQLDRIIIVLLALGLGYFAFDKFVLNPAQDLKIAETARQEGRLEAQVETYGEQSIAVLPFVNMSDDASNEYFSDGISEELLNLLAKIPQLSVIPRTSSFSFKGQDVPVAQIAQTLYVAHVLEGSVRKSGNQVHITAQLIRAGDSSPLWSVRYDRELDDIFAIQDEIAATVASKLKAAPLVPTLKIVETDPAAYDLLLRARQVSSQGTPEATERALDVYQQALAIDPDYAKAWAELAALYTFGTGVGLFSLESGYTLGREAAERALALDPDLALARTMLSHIELQQNRDLKAAVRHYTRAFALEPYSTDVRSGAWNLFCALDRTLERLVIGFENTSSDPLNERYHFLLGAALSDVERFDEALLSLRTAKSLSPRMPLASFRIGAILIRQGKPGAALVEFNQETSEAFRLSGEAVAYFAMGQLDQSDAALTELIKKHEKGAVLQIAGVLAYRKEIDRAFKWLDKAEQYNDSGLMIVNCEPFLDNLYDEPRWLQFKQRIGVAPEQVDAIHFVLPH